MWHLLYFLWRMWPVLYPGGIRGRCVRHPGQPVLHGAGESTQPSVQLSTRAVVRSPPCCAFLRRIRLRPLTLSVNSIPWHGQPTSSLREIPSRCLSDTGDTVTLMTLMTRGFVRLNMTRWLFSLRRTCQVWDTGRSKGMYCCRTAMIKRNKKFTCVLQRETSPWRPLLLHKGCWSFPFFLSSVCLWVKGSFMLRHRRS